MAMCLIFLLTYSSEKCFTDLLLRMETSKPTMSDKNGLPGMYGYLKEVV